METARARARLKAGLAPAWYGPAVAASLVAPALVRAWSQDKVGPAALMALFVSFAGLAVTLALVAVARRRTGVLVTRSWPARLRRSRVMLPVVLTAGPLAGALCWGLGAGEAAIQIVGFTVWGLGVWCACVVRNVAINRALRELA
ncbi:hypothetical protein [Streptomyces sp. NPDC051662]|uniref:hypothetical protein n=1 Tax=Streptomyces sp. NPDC051662 TaxID=3154750 RepID=UPI0034141250